MPAPAFIGAGSGVTIATGTSTVTKTSCTEGDLIILQVYYDGTSSDFGIGAYVNLEDLEGSSGLTSVTSTPVGATANFSVFMGRATADGTCHVDLTVGASGEDLVCRLYELSDVYGGTELADVLDNAEAAGNAGTSTTVAHATHTTHGDDRLVIELIGIDAAQALASFSGETGGDYTLEAEYQGTGTVGTIGLQTASISTANTLSWWHLRHFVCCLGHLGRIASSIRSNPWHHHARRDLYGPDWRDPHGSNQRQRQRQCVRHSRW